MNLRWPGNGLGLVLGCLGSIALLRCEAQTNLVPNHSFEVPDSCPATHTFLTPGEGPLQWFSGGGTTDYFQSCVPPPNEASIPQREWAFQYPQDGENFIGLITYEVNSGGIREYAMVELLQPLQVGQTYTVTFYANAAWNGTDSMLPQNYLASSHVGALFTMQPRPWSGFDPWPLATGSAHVWHPWIIADTVEWTLVSGSFVADSAYQYLMVGNHFDNTITDTIHFGNYIWSPKAYTLIDNVCVSQGLKGCPSANSVGDFQNSEVLLLPNPAIDHLDIVGLRAIAEGAIHDATGRVVWSGVVRQGRWTLDVGAWARGHYVLNMWTKEDHRSFKFVLIE
ncbi:MAG: T9SS type A sorting domain-containing protein [Flavobacteriales bacterium]